MDSANQFFKSIIKMCSILKTALVRNLGYVTFGIQKQTTGIRYSDIIQQFYKCFGCIASDVPAKCCWVHIGCRGNVR